MRLNSASIALLLIALALGVLALLNQIGSSIVNVKMPQFIPNQNFWLAMAAYLRSLPARAGKRPQKKT